MIHFLKGNLIEKKPTYIILEVNGVGYEVNIPLTTYEKLPSVQEICFVWTHYHVREDTQSLFGFSTKEERDFFEMLISISGIGPRLALSMMSGASVDDIRLKIISGDLKSLTSLPGIGPKTARRLIVELKEKFVETSDDELALTDLKPVSGGDEHDVYLALLSLGYRRSEALKAVRKVKNKYPDITGVDQILKMSLKEM